MSLASHSLVWFVTVPTIAKASAELHLMLAKYCKILTHLSTSSFARLCAGFIMHFLVSSSILKNWHFRVDYKLGKKKKIRNLLDPNPQRRIRAFFFVHVILLNWYGWLSRFGIISVENSLKCERPLLPVTLHIAQTILFS